MLTGVEAVLSRAAGWQHCEVWSFLPVEVLEVKVSDIELRDRVSCGIHGSQHSLDADNYSEECLSHCLLLSISAESCGPSVVQQLSSLTALTFVKPSRPPKP